MKTLYHIIFVATIILAIVFGEYFYRKNKVHLKLIQSEVQFLKAENEFLINLIMFNDTIKYLSDE